LGWVASAGSPSPPSRTASIFSAVTYTSLGLGDYYPTRNLWLIAGVEALNGLVLIGWSASFTYLAMETYWPLHRRRRHRDSQVAKSDAPPPNRHG
jgi:hypothetical protein